MKNNYGKFFVFIFSFIFLIISLATLVGPKIVFATVSNFQSNIDTAYYTDANHFGFHCPTSNFGPGTYINYYTSYNNETPVLWASGGQVCYQSQNFQLSESTLKSLVGSVTGENTSVGFNGKISFENNDYFSLDFDGGPVIAPFYAQIKNTTGGVMDLMSGSSTSADIIKTLPEDWVVYVASTTDQTGAPIIADGYHWYQVIDKTDDVSGWMYGEDATSSINYLPYDSSQQTAFEASSTDQIATSSRPAIILDAIDHYYNDASTTASLFSSDDGSNNISSLKDGGYPEELIWGIAAEEDGPSFDNEKVTFDYGHGIMQITPYQVYAHEATDDWAANSGDNRAVAAGITIIPCTSNASDLYKKCYVNGGDHDSGSKGYKHYDDNLSNPIYKYYTNTAQSIFANIKVGMHILADDKFSLYSGITTSTTTDGTTFSASDRRNILTTAAYNAIDNCSYVDEVADRLDDITSYFPSATTSGITALISQMHTAGMGTVCAHLHSPGNLTIQDSEGHTVGLVNGKIENNFPLAVYDSTSKFAEVLAAGNGNYTYRVVGNRSGTYGLDITIKNGEQLASFKASDIPILFGEIHTYSVNREALLKGLNGVTLSVDRNGNGVSDRVVQAGETLKGADYNKGATSEEIQASLLGDIDPPVPLTGLQIIPTMSASAKQNSQHVFKPLEGIKGSDLEGTRFEN